jgi:hypothetical protein
LRNVKVDWPAFADRRSRFCRRTAAPRGSTRGTKAVRGLPIDPPDPEAPVPPPAAESLLFAANMVSLGAHGNVDPAYAAQDETWPSRSS